MKLKDLLKCLDSYEIRGSSETDITDIGYHSKKVVLGSLFVAIPGTVSNGREYIAEAVLEGASAVVFEGPFIENLRAVQIRVSGAREALARLSAAWFDHPTNHIYLAGITGTNGKTTLTYILEKLWQASGRKTGVVGTVNVRFGSTLRPAGHTTPESRDLQEIFSLMWKNQVGYSAIEVSSHAAEQSRIARCHFDCCVFTNLSQDHLDFHPTMEKYFQAKAKLFSRFLVESLKENKLAIVGMEGEGEYGKRLCRIIDQTGIKRVTYGLKPGNDYYPTHFDVGLSGIRAVVQTPGGPLQMESPLIGRFNLLNILAAIGVATHSGVGSDTIIDEIRKFRSVPGRLEKIDDPGGRLIFVDYAHTPDALKNVLRSLKEVCKGKIITVFGCGGDRDRGKRPLMGIKVAEISDVCVVTSDNPRTEPPEKIIDEIIPGVEKKMSRYSSGKGFIVEPDRLQAISKALEIARKGDVVLIAGKGHEDYQIIGKEKYHFSDQEVVRGYLSQNAIIDR